MLPFPYNLIAAAGVAIALGIGGFFFGKHYSDLSYKAAIAKQEATAATLLEQLNATSAAKDALNAEHARDLETALQAKNSEIAANANAARRSIDDSLHKLTQCRQSRRADLSAAAANTAQPAPSAAGSQDRLLEGIRERIIGLGKSANKLGALVSTECVPWAAIVGR